MEKYPGRLIIEGDINLGGFEHPRDLVAIAELAIDGGENSFDAGFLLPRRVHASR